MLAIFVGLIEIGLGLGKLGFVADLLSKEVQVGYMNGLGITIIVGQLPKLFGFSTDADSFLSELKAFVEGLGQTHTATLVLGLAVLGILLVLPLFTKRLPAILVAVVAATVVSAAFGLADHGVATVGSLPQGVPTPGLPWTNAGDVPALLLAALGITLVSLTDTIATATSFAARRGDEVKPDQEMIGVGAANVAAGFFQGFAVSTSGSRTAVAEQSGAKTQLAGLVGAGLVAALLLFLNSLLADLPQAALAAVVIAAAISLMNLPPAAPLLRDAQKRARRVPGRHRRGRAPRRPAGNRGRGPAGDHPLLPPQLVAARRGSGTPGGSWRDGTTSAAYPDAKEVPGVVVYRWEAPLFFANSGRFRDEIRRLAREREPDWIVLQCEAITDVDVTAAEMLEQLDRELNASGIHLAFVELRDRLKELTLRYGLMDTLDKDHFYPSLEAAIAAIRSERAS